MTSGIFEWSFFAIVFAGSFFLFREFLSQFRYWLRERSGMEPREETLLDTNMDRKTKWKQI